MDVYDARCRDRNRKIRKLPAGAEIIRADTGLAHAPLVDPSVRRRRSAWSGQSRFRKAVAISGTAAMGNRVGRPYAGWISLGRDNTTRRGVIRIAGHYVTPA